MSLYHATEWKVFREQIIELDGHRCRDCDRSDKEVVLQIHHFKYIKGRKPWEYALKDCKTVCRGCHAQIHGIIKPQIGWEFIGKEDLGDLIGTCDNCGNSIRHSFLIQHENWGALEVGTNCCDKLTDTTYASSLIESQTSYNSRKKRFLNSKRWKFEKGIHLINHGNFEVKIKEKDSIFLIKIYIKESKKEYKSIFEAKSKVFEVIESGEFLEYLEKYNLPISEIKKTRKKSINNNAR